MSKVQRPVVNFSELELARDEKKELYFQFLEVDSMRCGIYSLPAGSVDPQQPHLQDEVYFVQSGEAKIDIEGTSYDVRPGSIVFVPAHAEHRFHGIKEDLKVLVIFSKYKPTPETKSKLQPPPEIKTQKKPPYL